MPIFSRTALIATASATVALAGCASSSHLSQNQKSNLLDAQRNISQNAAQVLSTQAERPNEQRIPRSLIRNARCVGVFPSAKKAALLIGGTHGNGLVACRDQSGDFAKAPPAAYNLNAGSLGLQAGAAKANVIVLFESQKAVQSLLNGKIELNGQIAATAGPSGWNRTIGQSSRAPVYVYSQSTAGLYAGLNLQGGRIGANSQANTALYGPGTTPSSILLSSNPVPASLRTFGNALRQWAAAASNDSGSS